MAKVISCFLLCLLICSCQSQTKKQLKNKPEISVKNNAHYFTGSWRFVDQKYSEGNEKKIYPSHDCMKKYTLVFKKENGNWFLTKNYATGKDCSVKSSGGPIKISINECCFSYWEGDLKKTEQYEILSENKFSIRYSDILDGKVREIEDTYEKQ
ncbi:hypothetical protein [Chryseobacterium sp. JUb7]|uniref:hypothetical protein n=1 Tax=Chryseobacterium sp. JUb7 TaxID=2940599 RepID=UPI002169D93E|nr:hypothetical protein [Chryseobacterium sp. JUb7]MCS3530740.1 hypothetical protein [Chryseobacterium sp. JUb7]